MVGHTAVVPGHFFWGAADLLWDQLRVPWVPVGRLLEPAESSWGPVELP